MKNLHQPNHVMIDLETMATSPDAAIVSIGAVIFDPRTNLVGKDGTSKVFYRELDWETQNRYICPETKLWWSKQSVQARAALFGLDDLPDALAELAEWLPKDAKVWGNGATFDITILENACIQLNIPIPWKFWNVRDCRTIKDIYESSRGGLDKKMGGVAHNSLHDAIYQAEYISIMWGKLVNK